MAVEQCFFDASQRVKPRPWDGRTIYPSAVEVKYDGRRLAIVRGRTRSWAFERSQTSEVLEDLAWFAPIHMALSLMPSCSALDGELWVKDGRATDVVTAIKNRDRRLRYQPFAVPWWDGKRSPCKTFNERDTYLKLAGFDAPARVITPRMRVEKEDRDFLLGVCESRNVEGLVMKTTPNLLWWKIKRVETVDAFVVGWTPGLGKHEGRIGALEVAVMRDGNFVPVASVGKGGDDQWRDLSPTCLLGRVMELSHEGVQAGGRLKFSSFLRWRDDKVDSDCDWSQIERAREG